MEERLGYKTQGHKLLEENMGSGIFDHALSNIFLDVPPQVRETKETINQWN